MAQVTLRINGYAYTVGCKDGEEQHLQAMAGEVERAAGLRIVRVGVEMPPQRQRKRVLVDRTVMPFGNRPMWSRSASQLPAGRACQAMRSSREGASPR